MTLGGYPLGTLVWASLAHPGDAARAVLSERMTRDVLWSALGLVAVLATLMIYLRGALFPGLADPGMDGAINLDLTPVSLAFVVFALMTIFVFVLDQVGRSLGGQGNLAAVLLTVAWTQGVFLVLDLGMLAVLALAPPLAGIASLAGLVLAIRATVHFLNEAHGFGSLGRATLTLVLSLAGLLFGLALILGLITSAATAMGALT